MVSAGSASKRRLASLAAGTALLVIAGVVGSVLAAGSVAHDNGARSRAAFMSSSAEIASTLQLAILHEQDLVVGASSFISENPRTSNAQLGQWAASVNALVRYPELIGLGYSVIVTAAELPAFAAQAVSDPTGPSARNGTFHVVPAGNRSYYCFLVASLTRSKSASSTSGEDLCPPGTERTELMSARDSGEGANLPLQIANIIFLSIVWPVYRGGVTPTTVGRRRSAFLGWVGMAVLPQVVLNRALQDHPNTAVILHYHDDSSNVTFQSGKAPSGAAATTINSHNGWTVTTFGAVTSGGLLGNDAALALLIAGIALSLLLGAMMLLLGTGRARALRIVSEQTGELRHQALHDGLTGLPNRALITDRIDQLLARGRRNGSLGAALYIDLDEFKNVNDTLGHQIGDRLLVAVAARLQGTLRDVDTIGRMGGDEFVVLIDGASLSADPELVADRLLEVIRQPFEIEGATTLPLLVNASIGIAIGDRPSAGDLLRDADVALYQAKAAGKNCYEIFNSAMQIGIQERIDLEFDLRSAVDGEQFRLVYQPIYNLDDLRLVGVEALLRWEHPIRGLIQPDEFIPILEQTGQIKEVGRWVLREACRQMSVWHARGDTLAVSVNVSGRQLDDDAVVQDVSDALLSSGLDATSLIIEITETALMRHADSTAQRLQVVKDLGVRIAVDDFGTGYSSLAYLQRFPVDCLKIDRNFISTITTSAGSKALVGTLVQLGKNLGLKTLAEGVETFGQMDHLRDVHVDEAQGFLLSRPLDPDVLEAKILAPARPQAGSYWWPAPPK